MKGVFIRLEKDELKDSTEELLETEALTVQLSSSTANLKKLRNSRIKLQKIFFKGVSEIDLEVEKIKGMLPEVKTRQFVFKPEPPRISAQEKTRRSKYEKELEDIKTRLHSLRKDRS